MNDPNGLVYANGLYHLFFQYHPHSTVWGPMHWGHAVSRDLMRWQDRPIALHPDGANYVFSGSAVVDASGDAGAGAGAIVALYTNHDATAQAAAASGFQSQHLAWSTDNGLSWTHHPANPVMPNIGETADFRDPKVFWHAPSTRWIAALAAGDRIEFWGSANLVDWEKLSEFGARLGSHVGVWECPDLFELTLPGADTSTAVWVLLVSVTLGAPNGGSGTQYFIGHFDGQRFEPDAGFAASLADMGAVWLDQGRDNYAGVTWSGDPAGRRILIGWMNNWSYARDVPASTWRGAMTVPTQLSLVHTPRGLRLRAWPIAELDNLRQTTHAMQPRMLDHAITLADTTGSTPMPCEIEAEFDVSAGATTVVGVELTNPLGDVYRIGFDAARNVYFSDRRRAGNVGFADEFANTVHEGVRATAHPTARMRLLFDVASAELFADDGEVLMTDTFFPTEVFTTARIFCDGAPVPLLGGRVHALRPTPIERQRPAAPDHERTEKI